LQRVQCNFAKKKQQKKNEFNSDLIKDAVASSATH